VIVACLEKLAPPRVMKIFINFALKANDENSANFMQSLAEIMVAYQQMVPPPS